MNPVSQNQTKKAHKDTKYIYTSTRDSCIDTKDTCANMNTCANKKITRDIRLTTQKIYPSLDRLKKEYMSTRDAMTDAKTNHTSTAIEESTYLVLTESPKTYPTTSTHKYLIRQAAMPMPQNKD